MSSAIHLAVAYERSLWERRALIWRPKERNTGLKYVKKELEVRRNNLQELN